MNVVLLVALSPSQDGGQPTGAGKKGAPKTRAKAAAKPAKAASESNQVPVAGHNRVDKYFGTKLPPVCERLGCYKSDDGKRFYCVNPACQKHRRRRTKHGGRSLPMARDARHLFRCPSCKSQDVDVVRDREYLCRRCLNQWQV